MTRIVIFKDGVTTDVPENELSYFLRLGYKKVDTLPDALPEKDQKLTPEEEAVNDALVDVAEAEEKLTEAENANDVARRSTLSADEPVVPKPKKEAEEGVA